MRTGSMCEPWASPGVHTRRSGEGGYQPSGGGLHDAGSPCECRFSVTVTRCTAARAAAYTLCLRHAHRAGGPAVAERDSGCSPPLDGMDIDTPAPGTGLPAHGPARGTDRRAAAAPASAPAADARAIGELSWPRGAAAPATQKWTCPQLLPPASLTPCEAANAQARAAAPSLSRVLQLRLLPCERLTHVRPGPSQGDGGFVSAGAGAARAGLMAVAGEARDALANAAGRLAGLSAAADPALHDALASVHVRLQAKPIPC